MVLPFWFVLLFFEVFVFVVRRRDVMGEELIIIDTGYAYFGLLARDGIIVQAPPIARWTIGKEVEWVMAWYVRKAQVVSRSSNTIGLYR